jgi:Family of unknown function (DUF6352)
MSRGVRDFWQRSGYRLLERDGMGRLAVTDEFLRAYLTRPEVVPIPESCAAERALHASLLDAPRRAVAPAEIARLADADARENYAVLLRFFDHLRRHATIEAAYSALFIAGSVSFPALFLDQLVAPVVRSLLEGTDDPFRARAGELLFRSQRASLEGGAIMLADEETVDLQARTGGMGSLGQLVIESGTPIQVELDVLNEERADRYWDESDKYATVLELSFARPGIDALARVLEAWVLHFLGAEVSIQPVQSIRDEHWSWHVGLDATANAIMNDLFEGRDVEAARLQQILGLFRLEFKNPSQMLARIRGRPVYLGLAMTLDRRVKLKPQNLLVNLPLGMSG